MRRADVRSMGNWLQIRHTGGWDTGYAHLSRYAKGIRPGMRVRQGQVVAYVGSTGMSTGAHLHYRFIKDGRNVDPLSTDLPTGTPLEGDDLVRFASVRDGLRARI